MSQNFAGHSLQAKSTKGLSQPPSNRKPFVSGGGRGEEEKEGVEEGEEGKGGGGRRMLNPPQAQLCGDDAP